MGCAGTRAFASISLGNPALVNPVTAMMVRWKQRSTLRIISGHACTGPGMRGHPEGSTVPLQNESATTTVHAADAQRWSSGPLKLIVMPTMFRLGLSARRSDLVCEDCVKNQGPDTRPRLQAGAMCVFESAGLCGISRDFAGLLFWWRRTTRKRRKAARAVENKPITGGSKWRQQHRG